MKKIIFFLLGLCFSLRASAQQSSYPLTSSYWEGAWWSYNVSMGSWFPPIDTLADFSIDDYSWGQLRSLDTVSLGDSLELSAQILVNSGGVNPDEAIFCVGDQWAFYNGNSYGIVFDSGKVSFWENGFIKDSIGTYTVGGLINFSLVLNRDGSLTANGPTFSGTYNPANVLQTRRWIIVDKDSRSHQGFLLESVGGSDLVTGVIPSNLRAPSRFTLSQNYPNPFNPTTVISYDIPKRSLVSLAIYDVLGRRVQTLVNDQRQPGLYQVTFDASKLPSGVYFYRLTAGSFVKTRKLVLLK
ncbi:MAG TPA: T9SS type A sorting domain-containing protein, partial [Candidatus Kryptobacter bacterium]|nr:T9SS type A sorting domain-containing protein [Candidatus Kryptobacter bacterium]